MAGDNDAWHDGARDHEDAAFDVAVFFSVESGRKVKIDAAFDEADLNAAARTVAAGVPDKFMEPLGVGGVGQEQDAGGAGVRLGHGLGQPLGDIFGTVRRIAPGTFATPVLAQAVGLWTEPMVGDFGVPIHSADVEGEVEFGIPRIEYAAGRAPFRGLGFGHVGLGHKFCGKRRG